MKLSVVLPKDEAVQVLQRENAGLCRRIKSLETKLRNRDAALRDAQRKREQATAAYRKAVEFARAMKDLLDLYGENWD